MPTVLIIDDDHNLRETLSDLVSGEGHTVLQASSGQEAIEILTNDEPDVALCDWRMAPLGGLDVLRAISQQDAEQRIPIIVLTAHGDAESTVQGDAGRGLRLSC